ncbi:MAG: hypothetical protein QOD32_3480, partial [Pyrinomonadaceae bacterium]|nr:hypothetical protein [Pyrinomonadaceae bacterium]
MAEKEPDKYLEMLDAAVKDSLHRLPTPHCEFITEGEQTTLVYKHQMGDFEVRFKPSKHLDAEALKGGEYLTKMMLDLEIAGKSIGELEESDKRREEYPQLIAIWFKMFFAHLLGNNAAIALRSTMRETDLITATFMQSTQIRPFVLMKGIKQIKASGVNEHLALILDETEKEKKEMLESYIFALQPTNLDRLREFYDAVYPVWHDIKDIAARYKDAWRGMIAAKYKDKTIVSDYTFESLFIEDIADDLLSRISGDV